MTHTQTTTVKISRKQSGNLIIATYSHTPWELVAECKTPKELMKTINNLGFVQIITSEYSKAQNKKLAATFNENDALKAFGLSASKANRERYF
jgi:RNase P/RNase MRP subunit p30